MSGTYHHKRPDKHKLVLEKAPSYIRRYPNIFGWNLPDLSRFHVTSLEETQLEGAPATRMTLTPKQGMGDILQVEVWVDPREATIPRQVTRYKGEGLLQVDVRYREDQGYKVFETMNARFEFPKVAVTATATATYRDYRFNQGLDDRFFNGRP